MERYTGRQIRCGIGTDTQEWVAVDDIEKEIENLITDIKHHFDKVDNPKLNTIRALNQILNKLGEQ